jgi:hypothetical protein
MNTQLTTEEFEKQLTRKAIKGVRHAAIVLNECYRLFWNRPTQVILDSMNGNLVETLQRFQANSTMGAALNAQLENTDVTERVILAIPEGYSFDGTQFIYTPPTIPEVEVVEFEPELPIIEDGVVIVTQPVIVESELPSPDIIAPPEQEIIEPPLPDMSEPS